ncbi:hypothetical protein Tco_1345721 [Tanacetum coccineum]
MLAFILSWKVTRNQELDRISKFFLGNLFRSRTNNVHSSKFELSGQFLEVRATSVSFSFIPKTTVRWAGADFCEQEGCTWSFVTSGIGFSTEEVGLEVAGCGAESEAGLVLLRLMSNASEQILSSATSDEQLGVDGVCTYLGNKCFARLLTNFGLALDDF